MTKVGCWLLIGLALGIGGAMVWGFADMAASGSGESTAHLVGTSLGEIGVFVLVSFAWSRSRRSAS